MCTSADVHTKHALSCVELKPLIIACSVKPMAVPELIYSVVLKWAEDWQMIFNPQKTEFLRITNKYNSIHRPIISKIFLFLYLTMLGIWGLL